jgi:HNH endonuclease
MPLDFSHSPFEVEHITPISKKGKNVSNNLALACRGCNLYKSDKTFGFDAVSDETVRLLNHEKMFGASISVGQRILQL